MTENLTTLTGAAPPSPRGEDGDQACAAAAFRTLVQMRTLVAPLEALYQRVTEPATGVPLEQDREVPHD